MQLQDYKFIPKIIGLLLTLLALYYLIRSFYQNSETVISSFNQPLFLVVFTIGILLYGLTLLIIVAAWRIQLKEKYPEINFPKCFYIVGISQIGKYLPGNIFHIASRFYLAKKLDIKIQDITSSLIFETILVVFSALLVGGIYFNFYTMPFINIELYMFLILAIFISLIIYLFIVNSSLTALLSIKKLILITVIFIVSHFVLGSVLYLASHYMFSGNSSLLVLTSILALSFVVGYITPGSPGGIGIREFVFLKLAIVEMDESTALSLIITLRLISISGDLLMYFIALSVKRRMHYITD